MTNKYSELDVLSPAVSGKLQENPSAFDDFWGVVVGFTAKVGEDEAEKRFFRQMVMNIRLDVPIGDTLDMWESYNLPTDPATGEPLVHADGTVARPNATSKWGVQEVQFDTALGVPWEGRAENLIGLHAHFVRKGTRMTREDITAKKRAPKGEPPYGRYVVEWDHYDNGVRGQAGLEAITTTFKNVQESAVTPPPAADGSSSTTPGAPLTEDGARRSVAAMAIGKNFLEQYSEIRKNRPELGKFATRDAINSLVADGLLVEEEVDGKTVYEAGPAL